MDDILVRTEPDGVTWVVLDRPRRRNAVTLAMWRRLRELFSTFAAAPAVRAVVLAGSGDHFCAGADIGEFESTRGDAAAGRAYEAEVDAAIEAIAHAPQPTIAAVSGWCLGGGCGLAMACDFRVAHASARFGIPAARLGIVYGVPDTRNLLSLVGLPAARRILFTGRRLDAAEARAIGLADEVVDGSLAEAVGALAAELAAQAPLSIAGAKLVLRALGRGEVTARAAEIDRAIERSMDSEDYREGVRAFAEKRPPRFTGR